LEGAMGLREKLTKNLLCLMPISFYNSASLQRTGSDREEFKREFPSETRKSSRGYNPRKTVHMQAESLPLLLGEKWKKC
jgi:hypothetical protein